jgi:hypothetical protein
MIDTTHGPTQRKLYVPILPPETRQSESVQADKPQLQSTSMDVNTETVGEEEGGMPDFGKMNPRSKMGKVGNLLYLG